MKIFCQILMVVLLTGCSWALKPGSSSVYRGRAQLKQSENPKSDSTQNYERRVETVYALPEELPVTARALKTTVTEKVDTKIGAAQKDTAREIGAKISSMKGIMWVGVLLFLFGIASAFWPPLRLIVGSITTSAMSCAAGVALMVLPSLVADNEILMLAVGVGAVGLYWFSNHNAKAQAALKELKK